MNTGIYEHLFEEYPVNEYLDLDVFQGALMARATLPYVKLIDGDDIFKGENK